MSEHNSADKNRRLGYAAAVAAIASAVAVIVWHSITPLPPVEVPPVEEAVAPAKVHRVFFAYAAKPPSKSSGIAGVGTGPSTGTQAQLTALGATWFFDWGANLGATRPGYPNRASYATEYVPMGWGAYSVAQTTAIKAWLATHPDSYVLLLNEPNNPDQANLFCLDAGKSIDKYAEAIWADYLDARLIVGGIYTSDSSPYTWQAGLAYMDCMMLTIQPWVREKIAGYHYHYYPWFEPITVPKLQGAVNGLCRWRPDKECWLTEFGLIGWAANSPNREQYMRDSITWLSTVPSGGKAPVTRWAWFALRCQPGCGEQCCPAALYLYDDSDIITKWGRLYQSLVQ